MKSNRKQMLVLAVLAGVMSWSVTGVLSQADAATGKVIKSSTTLDADYKATAKDTNVERQRIAAAYNIGAGDVVIDLNKHALTLQATSRNADYEVNGIFAERGTVKIVNGKEGKPVKITATGKNQAHGIYVVRGGKVQIDSDVKIEDVSYKMGAYGVWVADAPEGLILNGKLEIKKSVKAESRKLNHAFGVYVSGNGSAHLRQPVAIEMDGTALKTMTDTSLLKAVGGNITVGLSMSPKKYYHAMDAEKGHIVVNMDLPKQVPGTIETKIKGNIIATHKYSPKGKTFITGGIVDLGLRGAKSTWTGAADRAGEPTQKNLGKINLYIQEGALWNNKVYGKTMDGWSGSVLGKLVGGETEKTAGIIVQREKTPITVEMYKGATKVFYLRDKTKPAEVTGGDFVIRHADKNSTITLATDYDGLDLTATDKKATDDVFKALAHKLHYTAYKEGEKHLSGKLEIAEGLTAAAKTLKLGKLSFDGDGRGIYDPSAKIEEEQTGEYIPLLTRGVRNSVAGSVSMWYKLNNDVQRRLGELHWDRENSGLWARYIGGKNTMSAQGITMEQTYTVGQVGYDTVVGSGLVGGAFEYGTGNTTLTMGKADNKLTALSLYGTWAKEDGAYLDVIVKAGRLHNDVTAANKENHHVTGDYNIKGTSLSVEYGKRIPVRDGLYIEPSAEFTCMHVDGTSFTGKSDFVGNKEMTVTVSEFNSSVARIGLAVGKVSNDYTMFVKGTVAHEFSGKLEADFVAAGEPTLHSTVDLKDTWFDVELGGTYYINPSSCVYATYTRSFGAVLSADWRADVGMRFAF